MPMTPAEKTLYLQQARKEDGMETVPDENYTSQPDDPTIAQITITGRRRVGKSLTINGPTPVNPITRRDAIIAIDASSQTNLFSTQDRSSLVQDISTLTRSLARRLTEANYVGDDFEPDVHTTLNSPRPKRRLGYTRNSRLTPSRPR